MHLQCHGPATYQNNQKHNITTEEHIMLYLAVANY